ncbi:MAG: ParB N-terminal domain-containing protein [Erysipelotrichaceae bacterium]|nr:ParB N-terminal domain-containing protein [Erysipelotrichaceae bacterium]
MINTMVLLKEIRYQKKEPGELLASIRKRGIAIPVQVKKRDGFYECMDGNKRCSACEILQQEDAKYARIPIMILNDFTKAGSSIWGNTQNHH